MGTSRLGHFILVGWLFVSVAGFGADSRPGFLAGCFRGLIGLAKTLVTGRASAPLRTFPRIDDIEAGLALHLAAAGSPYEPISERYAFCATIRDAMARGALKPAEIPALSLRLRAAGVPFEGLDELRVLAGSAADPEVLLAKVGEVYPTFQGKLEYLAYHHEPLKLTEAQARTIKAAVLQSIEAGYSRVSREPSVASSGITPDQWAKIQREARAILSPTEFLAKFKTDRPASPQSLVALGTHKTPYDFGVRYAGASSFFDAYSRFDISMRDFAQTPLFMRRLVRSGAQILFFLPNDMRKTTHTRAEFESLMRLPAADLARVTFVFGMYDEIP